jgi:thymidylate synthase
MNKLDLDYQNLLRDILENGVEKDTRNGKTLSVFGRQIRHDMKLGFPLLTTKKMAWKTIVTELLWFLNGNTNIKYLVDSNCHIWDGDCYKNWCRQFEVDPNNFNGEDLAKGHNDQCWGYPLLENTSKEYKRGQINAYLEGKADKPFFYLTQEEFINKIKTDDEFADKYGDLGPIYGAQWRRWSKYSVSEVTFKSGLYSAWRSEVDQISKVIYQLKTNPDDRGIIVSAWNVSDLDDMVLRPCHYSFQFYTRELSNEERVQYLFYKTDLSKLYLIQPTEEQLNKENIPTRAISLMWDQRSCDFPLGIPANIMSYALLLMMVAKQVNMIPEELIGNFGDCHIYKDQIDGVKEQLTREPYPLPSVKLSDKIVNDLSEYTYQDIILENYQSHPKIYFPLSN